MKTIEAILPHAQANSAIEKLRELQIEEISVEPVRVFKKDLHRIMIYRGQEYEQNFDCESKLRFLVSEDEAARAQTIVDDAASGRSRARRRGAAR